MIGVTAVGLWVAGQTPATAQPLAPITYTLSFPAPTSHYVDVDAVVPVDGRDHVELMMAVWTPGSYLVREYARHVEAVDARTEAGHPLATRKTSKNRWRVDAAGAERVVVRYRVYSRDMSVRTNWVDRDLAMLNGAATFMTLVDGHHRPHDVRVRLPREWASVVTPLPPVPDAGPHVYRAADFDTLVDSPIVAGNPVVQEFTVAGTPHVLAHVGDATFWRDADVVADLERVVRAHHRLWGAFPYERYVFLNMVTEAGGAIEHLDSTLMMTSRWTVRDRGRYLRWLDMASHELFHAWNVKRLRPVELGPFDYEREVLTPSLWAAEGLTAYYGPLLVHRAGLSTRDEYLDSLSDQIADLQTTPGRHVQTLAEASSDAWIKYYRRHANSRNSTVSYYTKGAVLGFLLDARIRAATDGQHDLDAALRLAYQRYSGPRGYTAAEFEATIADVAGADVRDWLARAVRTTEELAYESALGWYGLEWADPPADDVPKPGWLGLQAAPARGVVIVTHVPRATPAYEAGVNVDDELVAIDDYRVLPDDWPARLEVYGPGNDVTLLVSRRGRLMRLEARLAEAPSARWRLALPSAPGDAQTARLDDWLGPAGERD